MGLLLLLQPDLLIGGAGDRQIAFGWCCEKLWWQTAYCTEGRVVESPDPPGPDRCFSTIATQKEISQESYTHNE
jgi:hypothetical protein